MIKHVFEAFKFEQFTIRLDELMMYIKRSYTLELISGLAQLKLFKIYISPNKQSQVWTYFLNSTSNAMEEDDFHVIRVQFEQILIYIDTRLGKAWPLFCCIFSILFKVTIRKMALWDP